MSVNAEIVKYVWTWSGNTGKEAATRQVSEVKYFGASDPSVGQRCSAGLCRTWHLSKQCTRLPAVSRELRINQPTNHTGARSAACERQLKIESDPGPACPKLPRTSLVHRFISLYLPCLSRASFLLGLLVSMLVFQSSCTTDTMIVVQRVVVHSVRMSREPQRWHSI